MLSGDYARHLERNITITYYLWLCCIHCQLQKQCDKIIVVILMRSTVVRLCSLTGS